MSKTPKWLLKKKRKRLLSTGEIAKNSGYTVCRIGQLWRDGKLPAELANPAEFFLAQKQPRFFRTPRLARWCRKRKERKELRRNRKPLKGDRREKPAPHYLTFVNHFNRWDRRVEIGLADLPSIEVMQREFERVQRRIIELCGVEWAAEILEAVKREQKEARRFAVPCPLDPFQKTDVIHGKDWSFRPPKTTAQVEWIPNEKITRSKTTPQNGQSSLNASD